MVREATELNVLRWRSSNCGLMECFRQTENEGSTRHDVMEMTCHASMSHANENAPVPSPRNRGVPITASFADPSAYGAGGYWLPAVKSQLVIENRLDHEGTCGRTNAWGKTLDKQSLNFILSTTGQHERLQLTLSLVAGRFLILHFESLSELMF